MPAHLTLFRSLPPSAENEVRRSLARAAQAKAPDAQIVGAMDLDSGVALRVASPDLAKIRADLAAEFHGLLSAQDQGAWTAHITIQNKVEPSVSRALLREMRGVIEPRPLRVPGLQLVRYVDGDWESLASWTFR